MKVLVNGSSIQSYFSESVPLSFICVGNSRCSNNMGPYVSVLPVEPLSSQNSMAGLKRRRRQREHVIPIGNRRFAHDHGHSILSLPSFDPAVD